MKTMKPLLLAVLLTSTSAFAQQDTIVNQINITQDAVKVAMEEFRQGRNNLPDSLDAQRKVEAFNASATQALTKFEETVRTRILKSFSFLVNQYNAAYRNHALGSARVQVMESIHTQLTTMALEKSKVYREAYLELYKVLPNFPISMVLGDSGNGATSMPKKNSACIEIDYTIFDCDRVYLYENEVHFASGEIRKMKFRTESYREEMTTVIENSPSGLTRTQARTMLLEGCYTTSCYFASQNVQRIWRTLVDVKLARDLVIRLDNGMDIKITRENMKAKNVLGDFIDGIKMEGLVTNLPSEMSLKRLEIFESAEKQISKNCKAAKKTLEELCTSTQEGCLQASEVALLKDRHGSKASCLK